MGHHNPVRLTTVAVSTALLYLCTQWSGVSERARRWRIPEVYTWAGSTLVSLLAWYELKPIGVAIAWMLLGVVLFEIGLERKSTSLRLQAYIALTASFVRLFFANLGEGAPGQIAPSVYTTLPVAIALFYVYGRMKSRPEESVRVLKWRVRAADYYSFMGATAVAALMRAELPTGWVVAGWAGLLVLLLALAHVEKQAAFLVEALILGAAIAYRAALFNFYDRSYFARGLFDGWMLPVGVAIALLFLSLAFAFRLRSATPLKTGVESGRLRRIIAGIYRRPEQFFFFVPVALLTVLLKLEFGIGMASLVWGMEAVVLFLFALFVNERSYRLTGLALLLVCVGKIVTWDVWQLNGSNRYLTLIGVGIALVVVSTLYTRYKDALRRYL